MIRRLEFLYGAFAFWTYELAFFVLLRPAPWEPDGFRAPDPITRAANLVVLLFLPVFAFRHRRALRVLLPHAALPALIVLYAAASALWSLDPATSLRRALSLATCFAFGFYALAAFGMRGTIRLYGWTLLIAALASWAALPLASSRVYDNDGVLSSGALRTFHGVFTQKNALSVEMLMGVCCWTYLGVVARRRGEIERWAWPLALLVMLAAMAYAKGTTSMAAALLVALATLWLRFPGWRFRLVLGVGVLGVAVTAVAVLAAMPELVLKALGKDASMTGRIPLWIESARAVAERPWLGWGYNAFWSTGSVPALYIWQRIGWPAPNAHNGPLELALDFGLLGGALYGLMLLRIVWRGLRARRRPEARFLLLLGIAMGVEMMDEGTLGWPDALTIMLAFCYALTAAWQAGPVRVAGPVLRPSRAGGSGAWRTRTIRSSTNGSAG